MTPRLRITDRLFLVHSDLPGKGKTRGMAKGPHLGWNDAVFAGGSAGFGLPVLKTATQTVFPSLHVIRCPAADCIEMVYDLNQILSWRCLGASTPAFFSQAFEKITAAYMKWPGLQQGMLALRNRLFHLFHIQSRMSADRSRGRCRVTYGAESEKLVIRVDGEALAGRGELILLNEAAGTAFSRLRINGRTFSGNRVPAWISCPLSACFENPDAGIGFSLGLSDTEEQGAVQLSAGREIGRGLDWAGFALTMKRPSFAYPVLFAYDQIHPPFIRR